MKRHVNLPGLYLLTPMVAGPGALWSLQFGMKGLACILGSVFALIVVIGAAKVKVYYS